MVAKKIQAMNDLDVHIIDVSSSSHLSSISYHPSVGVSISPRTPESDLNDEKEAGSQANCFGDDGRYPHRVNPSC